jgi:hypothetical protein
MLRGRRTECEVLDGVLDGVRLSRSAVLVMRGEPGIGKTALLDYLVEAASGFRVVRASGVESEMELPFAGLHELCAPMLGRLGLLAEPQRRALSVAFGLTLGDAPDRFLIGLAALSLLAETSEEQPLLCVVDDAQWLDQASAQVLGFVGRRLLAESIALVFAARTPVPSPDPLTGWRELHLGGLDADAARAVLATVAPGPLDEKVRARIIEETQGNPLAVLELGGAKLAGEPRNGSRRWMPSWPGEPTSKRWWPRSTSVGPPMTMRHPASRPRRDPRRSGLTRCRFRSCSSAAWPYA